MFDPQVIATLAGELDREKVESLGSPRLKALVRDLCADHLRESNLLALSIDAGIPQEMVRSPLDFTLQAQRLTRILEDRYHMNSEAASWAVAAWSEILRCEIASVPPAQEPISAPPIVEATTAPPVATAEERVLPWHPLDLVVGAATTVVTAVMVVVLVPRVGGLQSGLKFWGFVHLALLLGVAFGAVRFAFGSRAGFVWASICGLLAAIMGGTFPALYSTYTALAWLYGFAVVGYCGARLLLTSPVRH